MSICFRKLFAAFSLLPTVLFGLLAPCAASAQTGVKEVQVGTRDIIDFEFDWARDGVYCPSCNFGAGNSRLAYIDLTGKLWVGYVDFNTGRLYPSNGQAVMVDDRGVDAESIGNGPEWMVSERGSELVYSRWSNKRPKSFNNLSVGHAYLSPEGWVAGSINGSRGYVLPVGSLDINDPVPLISFQNFSKRKTDVYWRLATSDSVSQQVELGSDDPGVTRRWVPGTNKIIMTYEAPPVEAGSQAGRVYRQVYLYSPSDGTMEQLTFEPKSKYWAFMWQAPEYNNDFVFFVMVGSKELHVYRRINVGGVRVWTVINKIVMPDATPFVTSPEPFVHNGRSWIFFTVSSARDGGPVRAGSQVAMAGILPGESTVQVLTADSATQRVRRDPEYFITAKGPFLYYNRYAITPGGTVHEGIFRLDTGLGQTDPAAASQPAPAGQ